MSSAGRIASGTSVARLLVQRRRAARRPLAPGRRSRRSRCRRAARCRGRPASSSRGSRAGRRTGRRSSASIHCLTSVGQVEVDVLVDGEAGEHGGILGRRVAVAAIVAPAGVRRYGERPGTRTPGFSRRQQRRELAARADAELAVGVAEVHLDGLDGHEQRLRDLGVARPAGREVDDPPLARRQRVRARSSSGRRSFAPVTRSSSRARSAVATSPPAAARSSARRSGSRAALRSPRRRSARAELDQRDGRARAGRASARAARPPSRRCARPASPPRIEPGDGQRLADVAGRAPRARPARARRRPRRAAAAASPVAWSRRAIRSQPSKSGSGAGPVAAAPARLELVRQRAGQRRPARRAAIERVESSSSAAVGSERILAPPAASSTACASSSAPRSTSTSIRHAAHQRCCHIAAGTSLVGGARVRLRRRRASPSRSAIHARHTRRRGEPGRRAAALRLGERDRHGAARERRAGRP